MELILGIAVVTVAIVAGLRLQQSPRAVRVRVRNTTAGRSRRS